MSDEHLLKALNAIEPKTYRCRSLYGRMIYYAAGGSLGVLAAVAWMGTLQQKQGQTHGLWFPLVFGLVFMLPVWSLALMGAVWRLTIDRNGIAFRRTFCTHFWPWAAFRDGRVKRMDGFRGFLDPAQPWHGRVLPLAMLESEDFDEVYGICRSIWVAPPKEPLPVSIQLSVLPLNAALILSETGICRGTGADQKIYGWSDVQKLTVVLPERDRDDFYKAMIELPGTMIRFQRDQDNQKPQWKGASSSIVARYLKRYIPAAVTTIISLAGAPQTVEEVDYHLAKVRPKATMLGCLIWPLVALLTLLCLLDPKLEVFILALVSLPVLGVLWYLQRQAWREESKYLAIRDQLLAEADSEIPE